MTWYKYKWGSEGSRGEKGGKGWGVEGLSSKGFLCVTEDYNNQVQYNINKNWNKEEFLSGENTPKITINGVPKRYYTYFIKAIFEKL